MVGCTAAERCGTRFFLFLFDGLVLLCCRLEGPVFALGRRADICMAAEKEDERQRRDVRVLRTE